MGLWEALRECSGNLQITSFKDSPSKILSYNRWLKKPELNRTRNHENFHVAKCTWLKTNLTVLGGASLTKCHSG
jgi:hypothetical protein